MTFMSKKNRLIIYTVVLVIAVVWYFFRPELLLIDKTVNEEIPAATSEMPSEVPLLVQGQFRGIAHETSGSALIYQYPDGHRALRLMDFATSNGLDVHVYLVAAADAPDDESVKNAAVIDLGSLKGNIGDQNYEIPAGIDLNKFRTVAIWCKRFGVNFGSAPLSL